MTAILLVAGFVALVAVLVWANYRLETAREKREADPHLQAVAEHCWKTGKVVTGSVDENGLLTITEHEHHTT